MQKGTISVVTRLEARRGVFETPYRGPIYVLDVTTNNPGAAGGALVTRRGELAGMLGKELRNSLNNTWLNYAFPIEELRQSVDEIRAGKFVAREPESGREAASGRSICRRWGSCWFPTCWSGRRPTSITCSPVRRPTQAGIRPDDLIVLLGDRLVPVVQGPGVGPGIRRL